MGARCASRQAYPPREAIDGSPGLRGEVNMVTQQSDQNVERVHPSNNLGIFFIAVLVLLVVFTTTKLRGIYSVVTVVTVAFFGVLFAWFGWWDSILRFIPH